MGVFKILNSKIRTAAKIRKQQKIDLEQKLKNLAQREKCPNTPLFLVRIQSKYRKIRTRNNCVFGQFSRSVENNLTYEEKRKLCYPCKNELETIYGHIADGIKIRTKCE